uniref:Uncharacterized protein n=1 Tax=Rhizophora mucronata TaxID=61149 RepID=A0A2P2Q440_RHIMU
MQKSSGIEWISVWSQRHGVGRRRADRYTRPCLPLSSRSEPTSLSVVLSLRFPHFAGVVWFRRRRTLPRYGWCFVPTRLLTLVSTSK